MSYTVSFYLVDIARLREIVGGKDLSILDKIDISNENVRNCLKTLIMGDKQNQNEGSGYGYALEKIVQNLFGKSEEASAFEDLRYGEFDAPVLSWIIKSWAPVALSPNNDFPFIGHRFLSDMKEALADWNDDNYGEYEKHIGDMIEEMLEIFQTAVEQKKDLITFYY